jgi:hypothetical protein
MQVAPFFRRRFLLLFAGICLLASCSEDFEIAAPYKPVTIIYGLMNTSDTAHYIRIQKAFLDEKGDARVMAQVADSNFFDSLEVHMKELDNTTLKFDEILDRVDLNNEDAPNYRYRKDSGVFFNAPNWAYKTKRYMNPAYRYRLVVMNKQTGQVDSAETGIIDNSNNGFRVNEFAFGFVLHFPAIYDRSNFLLSITVPSNAQVFEGVIRFHYVDKDASGLQTDRSVDWSFATAQRIEGSPSLNLSVPERSFYSFLRSSIPDAPANVSRYMDTAEVFVWASSPDFATYQQINGAQGGLTADQIKPIYTNIKGKDVYGLYTSRAYRSRLAGIDDISMDSLIKSPSTRPLNFVGRSDH